jgi:transposase
MIRIDALWLCTRPQDMRAGADRLLAAVVNTVGSARAHHGYLFANARATRVKLLVHDGFGVWCATRRLHAGSFVWTNTSADGAAALQLTAPQFEALVVGLPWQRLSELQVIHRA